MNLKEAVKKWHVTDARARKYCKELGLQKQKGSWVIPDDTYPPVSVHDIGLFTYQFLAFKNNRPQSFDWASCGMPLESPERNIKFLYDLQYIAPHDIEKYKTNPSAIGLDDIFLTERAMSLLRKPKKNDSFAFVTINISPSLLSASFGGIEI